MGDYYLKCYEGKEVYRSKALFKCRKHANSLIKTVYKKKKLEIKKIKGIFKFLSWLPCNRILDYHGEAVVYKSKGLAKELGLKNLYIAFSGFWKERNAEIKTCSFKELEAVILAEHAKELGENFLVIPSAGNTARAFSIASKLAGIKTVVLVPEKNLSEVLIPEEMEENEKSVGSEDDYFFIFGVKGDYSRAIELSRFFSYPSGARNFAARDALATVYCSAVLEMKGIPEHYFQAISSGSGAIAAFEANERIMQDSRFGKGITRIHISQCREFSPVVDAWRKREKHIRSDSLEIPEELYAKVLANKKPAYSEAGGLYDVLEKSKGFAYAISKGEAEEARKIFEEKESIDIARASAICVASLFKAVEKNYVGSADKVLLNITSGGEKRANLKKAKAIKVIGSREELYEELRELSLYGR